MGSYNVKDIEERWQKVWAEKKVDAAPEPTKDKPPYFILVMFPYPSGNLHMGHVRNYTIGDIFARYHRRKGFSVLHPIGWDSFGLPAENAAIKNNTDPGTWTWANIAHMREQLKTLAISYDWDREVATCHPDYYRWNQWLFIKMVEKGLVYRKKAPVNWCPKDATVLANEQVHDGRCWRCETEVIQKELSQWFFKITDYAGELIEGHKQLAPQKDNKGWPEQVITMQRNWIGPSEGAFVDFSTGEDKIRVFTTRPDTLYGATFMVLAPEHPLVEKLTTQAQEKDVDAYREQAKKMGKFDRTSAEREKTGVFTGAYAVNPVNGKKIPVWIADYVLTDYGTGAIMAVPAHDDRDFAFATKFKIPIIQVIRPAEGPAPDILQKAYTEDGILMNSGVYDGLSTDQSKKKIGEDLKKKGLGEPTMTYKLRDWLLSRQRYWGTPIPIVFCDTCGAVPVPYDQLPVKLPENVKFTGTGASPLTQVKDWVNVTCPTCQNPAQRETDTMDTFVDSSWYYARYTDPKNTQAPIDPSKANTWIPVTQYVGGIEHACMHLIYSRFFHKVLRDLKLVSSDEPFTSLLTQGMVTLGGTAMSKSKGNVVDPTDVISRYGADTCRLFILFAAPPTQQLEWSDNQVEGIWRFINRVWRAAQVFIDKDDNSALKRNLDEGSKKVTAEELERQRNIAIKHVTNDIEKEFGFNTAISRIMELVNSIYLYPGLGDDGSKRAVETVVHLLQPFAPHICEEIWHLMGHKDLLVTQPWPTLDESKLAAKSIEIVVQVNGKVRDKVTVPAQSKEDEVKSAATLSLKERGIDVSGGRVIYVPNKLVNFVTGKN